MDSSEHFEFATLGGGCFWCLEAVFVRLHGVTAVVSGYCGGHDANPTYRSVCEGATGHAEVVQVRFDPTEISYRDLLEVFFAIHDPTTLNRQGHDFGTQYRSVIFTHSDSQVSMAAESIVALRAARVFADDIVTEVLPVAEFFPAENYHQSYFTNNPHQPYCQAIVGPKVAKFLKQFSSRLR